MFLSILTLNKTESLLLLLVLLLCLVCFYGYSLIQKLNSKIEALTFENNYLRDKKIKNTSSEDLVSIQRISTPSFKKTFPDPALKTIDEKVTAPKLAKNSSTNLKKQSSKDNYLKSSLKSNGESLFKSTPNHSPSTPPLSKNTNTNFSKTNPVHTNTKENQKPVYQKNLLSHASQVTSPVSIDAKETFDMEKLTLDLNEFIKKSEKVVPHIPSKQATPKANDYLKNLSEKLAEEVVPQTIDLTDYEKEQEENAIISYQELLSVKDQLEIIEDDEGTIDFIEELKKFRNKLN